VAIQFGFVCFVSLQNLVSTKAHCLCVYVELLLYLNLRVLTEASPIINHPLCNLSNLSLRVAFYPNQWKRANITPVFNSNKQNDVNNNRPISLLSAISKCMERCVYQHIHSHLMDNNIITTCQSGFIKGDAAVNQLINITNDFGKVR
jgi:hypothetical protein